MQNSNSNVLIEPRPSRFAQLRARLAGAYRSGGIGQILADLHNMVLYRIHTWFLDPIFMGNEMATVASPEYLDNLSIDSPNRMPGLGYTPSPYLSLKWIIDDLPCRAEDCTFVDVGSGRGRVVGFAARYPFKSVVGVEFAREFHDDAKRYIASLSNEGIQCASIALLHDDATSFPIPDGACAFFLFNPFDADVLEKFVAHVKADYDRAPRPFFILYSNPKFRQVFDRDVSFVPMDLSRLSHIKLNWLCPHQYVLYEYRPGGKIRSHNNHRQSFPQKRESRAKN